MSTLEEWTAAVRAGLGLDPGPLGTADSKAVLDLARDVAHAVDRPAAPLTAYLLGVAVGRGRPLPDASARVRALAAAWAGSTEPADGAEGAETPGPLRTPYGAALGARAGPRSPTQEWRGIRRADEGKVVSTQPRDEPRPTRRGVLLGASLAGLGGLGGALAGCSTAAVPYGADEAGVIPQDGPAPSAMAMAPSAMAPSAGPAQGGATTDGGPPGHDRGHAAPRGTVLGAAREIPVGGGTIFTAARVVVTQPARGQYRAFSAVCTHVGCVLNQVTGGTINCPCHGSRFTIANGAVVTGPAPAPLPKKQIKIVDGAIVLT